MKTTLAYLYVEKPLQEFEHLAPEYEACARRFADTYKKFPPGCQHELVIIFSNSYPSPKSAEIFAGLNYNVFCYFGSGWCTGAAQDYCQRVATCDFFVFACARTYFKTPSWLARFVCARLEWGHGFYGTHASLEPGPTSENQSKNPHLRTNFYGCHPSILASKDPITSRSETFSAESGALNFGKTNRGWLVTWDGVYGKGDWRKPGNIYRRGDQSNCIVFDRQTETFELAAPQDKAALSAMADGTIYP